ncbi:unnamed protein product [Moneuplotes crassus]|uniref:Centromere protein J C-terminal domain-containing protein n=1 Tax=Euplotes crassus TaxID=5936 RepID=A0AAD1Y8W8_EUPCR|nr:unnamed protein product [Moneuplotes crassus]
MNKPEIDSYGQLEDDLYNNDLDPQYSQQNNPGQGNPFGSQSQQNQIPRGFRQMEQDHDQYKQMMDVFKKDTAMLNKKPKKKDHFQNDENDPSTYSKAEENFNIDDVPIGSAENNFGSAKQPPSNPSSNPKANKAPKRTFLKRSGKSTLPKKTKKYTYYASNFKQPEEKDFAPKESSKPKTLNRSASVSHQIQPAKVETPEEKDGYNSVEEFEKLEEQCINDTIDENPQQKSKIEKKKPLTAMEMVEKKMKERTKKLFDDFESDQSENSSEEEVAPKVTQKQGKKSNVVKRMIYNEKSETAPKPKPQKQEGIPKELEEILNQKKRELDFVIQNYKREYDMWCKSEKEYSKLLNEYNRNSRLSAREVEKMKEEVDKRIEEERNKLKRDKRVAERQNKTMKNLPNRREREEIEALNKELKKLNENIKIKDQRHKLNIERLKKQVNESKKRNDELMEERDNVHQALQSLDYQEDQEHGDDRDDYNEERKDQKFGGSNKNQNGNDKKQINFYEQVNEESKGSEAQDYDSTSHSPHFGSQKFDFEDQKVSKAQETSNFARPIYLKTLHEKPSYEEANSSSPRDDAEEEEDAQEDHQSDNTPEFEYDSNTYEMRLSPQYHNNDEDNCTVVQENTSADGKIVRWYANNKKEVIFKKGVRKEIFPDGYTIVYFKNKDVKQTYPDGTVVYYFDEAKTTQTTDVEGTHIYKFENEQIEKHYQDGSKEIQFPDGIIKCIYTDGSEECVYPDGSIQTTSKEGVKSRRY